MRHCRQLFLLWELPNRKSGIKPALMLAKVISDTSLSWKAFRLASTYWPGSLYLVELPNSSSLLAKADSVQSLSCYVWINTLGWGEIVWLIGVANRVGKILQKTTLYKWGMVIVLRQSFLLHFHMFHEWGTHCPSFGTIFTRTLV